MRAIALSALRVSTLSSARNSSAQCSPRRKRAVSAPEVMVAWLSSTRTRTSVDGSAANRNCGSRGPAPRKWLTDTEMTSGAGEVHRTVQQWLVEGVASVFDLPGGRVDDKRVGLRRHVVNLRRVAGLHTVT